MEERRLTEELKQQMLGSLPFSVNASYWYVPTKFKDVPPEYQPTFELKSFNKEEAAKAKKIFQDMKNTKEETVIELLRKKIVSWKNVFDIGTGLEIPFKADDANGGCDKESLELIPPLIIGDLLFQVSKISGLLDIDKLGLKA